MFLFWREFKLSALFMGTGSVSTAPFILPFNASVTVRSSISSKSALLVESLNSTHLIKTGDHVIVRPADSNLRPYIGEVRKIVNKQRSTNGRKCQGQEEGEYWLMLKWFYRGEELPERPKYVLGEDELLETELFDMVEANTVVGKAEVLSYKKYKEGLTGVGEEERGGFFGRMVRDGQECRGKGGMMHEVEETRNDLGTQQIDGTSDRSYDGYSTDGTYYADNYSSASLRYYVRSFYDMPSHTFVPSNIDDPTADPYGELMSKVTPESDSEYEEEGGLKTDDGDDINFGDGWKPRKKQRAVGRGRKSKPGVNGHCFVLPGDSRVDMRSLPCRDREKAEIRLFLEEAILSTDTAKPRCLYISGVPGTGKTATVREILGTLEQEKKNGSVPPFQGLEVNGLSLADPNFVYPILHQAITGHPSASGRKSLSPMHAASLLDKYFRNSQPPNTDEKSRDSRSGTRPLTRGQKLPAIVLVLDEMDALLTRKQRVLYDLVDWTTCARGGLALIGIANTMDLPERRLLPRIGSRLGLRRVVFAPYTASQMKEILLLRLDERYSDIVFQPVTLQLVSAKVAAVSGDVRRALEICTRAVEIATETRKGGAVDDRTVITPEIVNKAVNDLSGAGKVVLMQNLSRLEKVVVLCVIRIIRRVGLFNGIGGISLATVVREVTSVGVKARVEMVSKRDIENAAFRLESRNILMVEMGASQRDEDTRIVLGVLPSDVACAFEGSDLIPLLNSAPTNPIG